MPKPVTGAKEVRSPWWLADGEEECPHCGQLYFLEVEVRCTHCDGPTCPHCRVRHREGHLICPGCVESEANG
jgi:hypothetical protein